MKNLRRNGTPQAASSIAFFILCVAGLLLASGCSGGGTASPAYQQATNAAEISMKDTVSFDGFAGGYGMEGESGGYDDNGSYYSSDIAAGGSTVYAEEDQKNKERKEIKNVNCQLVVKDVPAAYVYISDKVAALGGYEFSKTESKNNGVVYYSVTIKLPPENLPEFEKSLRAVEGENALRYFNLYSDDITSVYYDAAARLESMTASMRQYYALIAKATTVKDMLEIQREITALQADIDSLQGQINVWNSLVGFATINLTIERESDPLTQTKNEQWSFNTPSEIVNSMGNGFIATGNVVYQVVVGLFVVIVSLLPVLVPAGLIVLIIIAIRRKSRKKNIAGKSKKVNGQTGAADQADSAAVRQNIAEAQQYMETAKQYMETEPPKSDGDEKRSGPGTP